MFEKKSDQLKDYFDFEVKRRSDGQILKADHSFKVPFLDIIDN